MKRPSFQFYPGDWLRDMGLRGCSIEARGLWVDLLCLMHDGRPYGHLSTERGPWTDEQGARATGMVLKIYRCLMTELDEAGVFSRDDRGAIYSRRMVKDEDLRAKRAEAGYSGGSKTQANRQANTQANIQANGVAEVQLMVASADADADAEGLLEKGSGEKPTGAIFARLLTKLGRHPSRFAILDLLTEHLPPDRDPDTWAGLMIGCLDGMALQRGTKATIDELAAACLEYPGIKQCGWSPAHFLASVNRTVTRLRKPDRTDGRPTLANIEKANADFMAGHS